MVAGILGLHLFKLAGTDRSLVLQILILFPPLTICMSGRIFSDRPGQCVLRAAEEALLVAGNAQRLLDGSLQLLT